MRGVEYFHVADRIRIAKDRPRVLYKWDGIDTVSWVADGISGDAGDYSPDKVADMLANGHWEPASRFQPKHVFSRWRDG